MKSLSVKLIVILLIAVLLQPVLAGADEISIDLDENVIAASPEEVQEIAEEAGQAEQAAPAESSAGSETEPELRLAELRDVRFGEAFEIDFLYTGKDRLSFVWQSIDEGDADAEWLTVAEGGSFVAVDRAENTAYRCFVTDGVLEAVSNRAHVLPEEDVLEGARIEPALDAEEAQIEEDETLGATSGTVGSLNWKVESSADGSRNVLTVWGSGAIPDYTVTGSAPWRFSNLTEVILEKGVTRIGDHAFAYQYNLSSISIPEGVTSIGSNAFVSCKVLREVDLPSTVREIEYEAFYNSGLSRIGLKKGLTTIGYSAFAYCDDLTSIVLPSSVSKIGSEAFTCSGLKEVVIGSCSKLDLDWFYLCDSDLKIYILGTGNSFSFANYEGDFIFYCYKGSLAESCFKKYGLGYKLISVKLTPTESKITIDKNTKYTLGAMFEPAFTEGKITYSSSNTTIATVSASGVVTGKKQGSCTITMKFHGATAKVSVLVKDPPKKLTLTAPKTTLAEGE